MARLLSAMQAKNLDSSKCSPEKRLACNGRPLLAPTEFQEDDLLYRSFSDDDLDDHGKLDANSISMPDLSCNWGRFSVPADVRLRVGASSKHGCYSIQVADVRYRSFANAIHDPLCCCELENYSHVEVRTLEEGESFVSIPPKARKKSKSKAGKALRAEWRANLCINLQRIIEPGA